MGTTRFIAQRVFSPPPVHLDAESSISSSSSTNVMLPVLMGDRVLPEYLTKNEELLYRIRTIVPLPGSKSGTFFPFSNDGGFGKTIERLEETKIMTEDDKIVTAILIGESNVNSLLPELDIQGIRIVILNDNDLRIQRHTYTMLKCLKDAESPDAFRKALIMILLDISNKLYFKQSFVLIILNTIIYLPHIQSPLFSLRLNKALFALSNVNS